MVVKIIKTIKTIWICSKVSFPRCMLALAHPIANIHILGRDANWTDIIIYCVEVGSGSRVSVSQF